MPDDAQSIDHVTIRVSDFAASRAFYDTVLAPLGLVDPLVGELGVEWGDFSIAHRKPGETVTAGLHIAFAAASREQVDAFHAAALAAGHPSNGAPGERDVYHAGYYGAYVLDPDGNNVEAVFHDRPRSIVPRSLSLATDIDVLPADRIVERREGYLLVRSPRNPAHYWGNLLLFDREPVAGDAERWEALFAGEFGDEPRVRHRTFAWDRTDGVAGAAHAEFGARGYDVVETIGLVAEPRELVQHPRASRDVVVRQLDPAPGADEELWEAVVEVQVAGRDEGHAEADHRAFTRARLRDRRELLGSGRGGWYVAIDPDTGAVAGSCGVVVSAGRGRYQVVDTALAYRRRGVASRLVVEAGLHASEHHGAEQLVIVAEAGYHALGLYESLGFRRREHVFGVCFWERSGT